MIRSNWWLDFSPVWATEKSSEAEVLSGLQDLGRPHPERAKSWPLRFHESVTSSRWPTWSLELCITSPTSLTSGVATMHGDLRLVSDLERISRSLFFIASRIPCKSITYVLLEKWDMIIFKYSWTHFFIHLITLRKKCLLIFWTIYSQRKVLKIIFNLYLYNSTKCTKCNSNITELSHTW